MTGNVMHADQNTPTEIEQLRFALQAANVGTWDYNLLTNQAQWSGICKELFGLPADADVTAALLLEQVHPDDCERVALANSQVLGPASNGVHDITFRTLNPQGIPRWVQAKGQVIRDEQGHPVRFSGIVVDVTQPLIARRQLEESEQFARSLFDHSPVANVVFVGQQMVIQAINENMLSMLGRDASITGLPFMEAMPELIPTPLMDRLRHVLDTGETYCQPEERIDLIRNGQAYTGYYNYIYKALQYHDGKRYGVIVTATEVTQLVSSRQQAEEAEERLRGAIELAELGTWSTDLPAVILDYSPRLRNWLGIRQDELITVDRAYSAIAAVDRPRVKVAMLRAIAPGSNEIYDIEYTTLATQPGQERILHAQGRAYFDQQGLAYKISGTVQDVTQQRQLQQALEEQVQQRTEELDVSNEELIATNEKLLVANDEFIAANRSLETANNDLIRSNQNLEQFAYIASHDLQEPLRKIQQFSDLLQSQYGESLGQGVDYLRRMQLAASRMSVLIKDLLAFSRITTSQATADLVSLSEVTIQAIESLSVAIEESGAQIEVDELPTIQGDRLQLSQLFQNLLSNALKFRRTSPTGEVVTPQISVRFSLLLSGELPASAKPTRSAKSYCLIEVKDNGIGFEEKYLDRIFQVFQRLHGRNEFAGTGIGLAIVQKVVTNHGGTITATSQPGHGATFSIYLPA